MKVKLLIILILTINKAFGQIDFKSDTLKVPLFPDIINETKNFCLDYDFQFRFWIHGGITLPDKKDLFVMTQKNGDWNCQHYRFIYHKKKKYKIVENKTDFIKCDSIWDYLMANKITDLPDMQTLKDKFYYLDSNGDTAKIMVMDGLLYTFEFINSNNYKRIEYHCPITYGLKYSHIRELYYVSNIVRMIYKQIGNYREPC